MYDGRGKHDSLGRIIREPCPHFRILLHDPLKLDNLPLEFLHRRKSRSLHPKHISITHRKRQHSTYHVVLRAGKHIEDLLHVKPINKRFEI